MSPLSLEGETSSFPHFIDCLGDDLARLDDALGFPFTALGEQRMDPWIDDVALVVLDPDQPAERLEMVERILGVFLRHSTHCPIAALDGAVVDLDEMLRQNMERHLAQALMVV